MGSAAEEVRVNSDALTAAKSRENKVQLWSGGGGWDGPEEEKNH